jgi:hypothetical protein
MELTAPRFKEALVSGSLKRALTMSYYSVSACYLAQDDELTWQSSKVPVTARLWTLASVHVVICSSWIGLTRPLGCRMVTDTSFLPRRPWIAADPVYAYVRIYPKHQAISDSHHHLSHQQQSSDVGLYPPCPRSFAQGGTRIGFRGTAERNP